MQTDCNCYKKKRKKKKGYKKEKKTLVQLKIGSFLYCFVFYTICPTKQDGRYFQDIRLKSTVTV